jgi:hypothetical protein
MLPIPEITNMTGVDLKIASNLVEVAMFKKLMNCDPLALKKRLLLVIDSCLTLIMQAASTMIPVNGQLLNPA